MQKENIEDIIDIQFDDNLNAYLIITCPKCKKKNKLAARSISKSKEFSCPCTEFDISFTDNEFNEIQKSLDNLKRTLKAL